MRGRGGHDEGKGGGKFLDEYHDLDSSETFFFQKVIIQLRVYDLVVFEKNVISTFATK